MARIHNIDELFEEMNGIFPGGMAEERGQQEATTSSCEAHWNRLLKTATKTPTVETKRMFDRIIQVHAAHQRDIVIMIRYNENDNDVFRYWGSPGSGNEFLNGNMGQQLKSNWENHFDRIGPETPLPSETGGKISHEAKDTPEEVAVTVDNDLQTLTYEEFLKDSVVKDKSNRPAIKRGRKPKRGGKTSSVKRSQPCSDPTHPDIVSHCDPTDIYYVENVLSKRLRPDTGKLEYLVKWLGWEEKFNTWEPDENIIDKSMITPKVPWAYS